MKAVRYSSWRQENTGVPGKIRENKKKDPQEARGEEGDWGIRVRQSKENQKWNLL